MSSAVPGRLRDFFSSRTGFAVAVVACAAIVAAGFALKARNSDHTAVAEPPTTTSATAPAESIRGVLLGASTSPEVRGLQVDQAEKSAVQALEQRIVTIFRNQGADNVRWVWCPNAWAFNDGTAQQFYPGDDFVDWTCADGYNWAPGRPRGQYPPFMDIFQGFYGWASLKNKPIMV